MLLTTWWNRRWESARAATAQGFLPDFCANYVVCLVILIAQLLALILALNGSTNTEDFLFELGWLTLFIQWTAMISTLLLCGLRNWLNGRHVALATLLAFALIQMITLAFSLLSLAVVDYYGITALQASAESGYFLVRNLSISSIITLLTLRYLYIQYQWQIKVRAEAEARLYALQARIRPHFLYNSLNTAASLAHHHPEQSEKVILDLADLFRSALAQRDTVSLEEELAITRRYLDIEGLRLGKRLRVKWTLADDLILATPVPALIMQPLVENAVYHGIQPLPEGGVLHIRIDQGAHALFISVSNPLPGTAVEHQGNRIAQDNIRQRLLLAYNHHESKLSVDKSGGEYRVSFSIPCKAAYENFTRR